MEFVGALTGLPQIGTMYTVRAAYDGDIWQARPQHLRLKRPPAYPDQFTAGSWDLIPWSPNKQRVPP